MILLQHPIQNRVRYAGIANPRMPTLNGQLADESRLVGGTVVDDFQQVRPRLAVYGGHALGVKQQHICLGQGNQPLAKAYIATANA